MEINAAELKHKLAASDNLYIIDVREPYEYDDDRISEVLLPLGDIMDNLQALEQYKSREIVVYCKTGKRSTVVADLLSSMGFPNVAFLSGGLDAWRDLTE